MKIRLIVACATMMVAGATFGQSTSVTTSGNMISGIVQQTLAGKTVTVTITNGVQTAGSVPNSVPQGVDLGSMSAGLSIGAIQGAGFGSTGGVSGSAVSALKF